MSCSHSRAWLKVSQNAYGAFIAGKLAKTVQLCFPVCSTLIPPALCLTEHLKIARVRGVGTEGTPHIFSGYSFPDVFALSCLQSILLTGPRLLSVSHMIYMLVTDLI